MKIKELAAKKDKELIAELRKINEKLTKLKFEIKSRETSKHTDLGVLRKDFARIKTILREREIQRVEEKDEKTA